MLQAVQRGTRWRVASQAEAVEQRDNAPEAVAMLNRARLHESDDLKAYCDRLSQLPLAVDSGTGFNCDGVQIVVLGWLVEVVARAACQSGNATGLSK